MSDQAHAAADRSPAPASPASQPQVAPALEFAVPQAEGSLSAAVRLLAGGGQDGGPALPRFPATQRHQALLALQPVVGNRAVTRLVGEHAGWLAPRALESSTAAAWPAQGHTIGLTGASLRRSVDPTEGERKRGSPSLGAVPEPREGETIGRLSLPQPANGSPSVPRATAGDAPSRHVPRLSGAIPGDHDAIARQPAGSDAGAPAEPNALHCDADPIERIEEAYRAFIAGGRLLGMSEAADMLEHYLSRAGTDRVLAHTFVLQDPDARRQRRALLWGVVDRATEVAMATLQPGVACGTKIRQRFQTTLPVSSHQTRAVWYAMGRFGLQRDAELTLQRHCDAQGRCVRFEVVAVDQFSVDDEYDWHPGLAVHIPRFGTVDDQCAERLRQASRARTFWMRVRWTERQRFVLDCTAGVGYDPSQDATAIPEVPSVRRSPALDLAGPDGGSAPRGPQAPWATFSELRRQSATPGGGGGREALGRPRRTSSSTPRAAPCGWIRVATSRGKSSLRCRRRRPTTG